MAEPIGFDDRLFPSKVSLVRAIQAEIRLHPMGVIFQSELLSDLVRARHPYCKLKHLKPSHFRKMPPQPGRGGYLFKAFFPQIGWRSLSWRKAVDPTTFHDEARTYLRWNLIPFLNEAKKRSCQHCGSVVALEVHHEKPTFQEMYQRAAQLFEPAEMNVWKFYNWDGIPGFRLPPEHPVFIKFMELHNNALLETLCQKCHQRETKRGRRLMS